MGERWFRRTPDAPGTFRSGETARRIGIGLLRLRLSGQRVEITDETRVPYQELADAELVDPVHTFTKGCDAHYRLTRAAMERKAEFLSVSIPVPLDIITQ